MKENSNSIFNFINKSKRASVLVVDDDRSMLRTFKRVLQSRGYLVDTAETGRDALRIIQASSYDIFLVDIRLPDIDGWESLPKFKINCSEAPIIMMTGFPSLETGVNCLDNGADAYLVKPIKPQELLILCEEKLKVKMEKMKKEKKKYFSLKK